MTKLVIGIGGGIAAYKCATLVSRLVQAGHDCSVVLTYSGAQFLGPSTFAALTGKPPITELFDSRYPLGPHIELANDCDLLIVAPATARILGSFAHGLADDLLSTLYLNCDCPVLLAPAMSTLMWEKPSVQRNVSILRDDGVQMVGPESGWLSCRRVGVGRMSEPEEILVAIQKSLSGSR